MKTLTIQMAAVLMTIATLVGCGSGGGSGSPKGGNEFGTFGQKDLEGQWKINCRRNERGLWTHATLTISGNNVDYREGEYADGQCRRFLTSNAISGTSTLEKALDDGSAVLKYTSSSANRFNRYQRLRPENGRMKAGYLETSASAAEKENLYLEFSK